MKNIVVIFGGESPEHDVSIITGCLVLNSLDREKFNPIPVYVDKKGDWYYGEPLKKVSFYRNPVFKGLKKVCFFGGDNILYTKKGQKALFPIAAAVNCMHGGMGENGTIGALFDFFNIPFVTSGLFSASLSMDKTLTKLPLKALGVRVVDYLAVGRREYFQNRDAAQDRILSVISFPLIVKPASSGSSIGVGVCRNVYELDKALCAALRFDHKAIVEKFLEGAKELNCAAYKKIGGIVVSRIEMPVTSNKFLTFDDKYLGHKQGYTKSQCPAPIPKALEEEILSTTRTVYDSLDFSSVVRMDYLYWDKKLYLNEINTVPGSFAYYLFSDTISGLTDLLTDLLVKAMDDHLQKMGSERSFSSSILSLEGVNIKK